jgi:beta-galactosidase
MIEFKLLGDAKIIGVGNGDPSSHEADFYRDGKWQRSSFNGKCQVIIQAGRTKSKQRFEALLDGIHLTTLDLECQ